jgi:hypothetical protein
MTDLTAPKRARLIARYRERVTEHRPRGAAMIQDEPTMFIAMRVDEVPTPYAPSITWTCVVCRAVVWVSKDLVKEAFAADEIVCCKCAMELEDEER